MAKNNFYAVKVGRRPGIYTTWEGASGALAQVSGFQGARYKGFASRSEAERWLEGDAAPPAEKAARAGRAGTPDGECGSPESHLKAGRVVLFTDGSSRGNPGPGGYGVILLYSSARKELSGGFRRTTNNRMELTAAIAGLEALTRPSEVVLYTDSRYLANGISKGWARRWQKNNWMRTKDEPAENADLWARLLTLCDQHRVTFCWLRGHAGDAYNERCDELAVQAASAPDLPADPGYKAAKS